ncbi:MULTISPECIES: hypothetical protein [Vibrio]|uniref:Uncharacterized protein n=1 Tax=Vibrio tasmaniensis TaxID=212663 RepID=A0A2N7NCP9_9VIBR|nr:hypothetical protein [Vibrio tasmaniensis]PMO89837.1 hypothetical protein BCT01_00720 [Vibrio tasmaniensis]PMP09990.1 hypothetical protein BCS92_02370 [Vibrio tasmaniensis]TKG32626.1 hypothetical protein FC057_12480 [Vibrio tasmaniensis]TKG41690.1 hypothetical protein FC063_07460 [Vibrio tasmaniensis]TKG52045.1 hypothetical protein FC070_09730 [Vibrio tasmaniensis]
MLLDKVNSDFNLVMSNSMPSTNYELRNMTTVAGLNFIAITVPKAKGVGEPMIIIVNGAKKIVNIKHDKDEKHDAWARLSKLLCLYFFKF